MGKIIIVSYGQSYLMTSLKEQLGSVQLESQIEQADVNALHDVTAILNSKIKAFFLQIDEGIINEPKVMIFIRDYAMEHDVPIFLLGGEEDLAQVYDIFPSNLILKAFKRPVNVKDVASDIEYALTNVESVQKKKILVVDDSGSMLRNVKAWLEDKYQVKLANSGAMAIKALSLETPDLVLLDYEMPIMDGRQVLEIMRSEMDFSDIPVIFLTGKGDKESVMNVMKLKPAGYMLKSLPPAEIIKTIDDFFIRQKHL